MLDPSAFFGRRDVHELGADGRGVDAARVLNVGVVLVWRGIGNGEGRGGKELSEGVEGGLEVAPAAEEVEGSFSGSFAGDFLCAGRHAPIGCHGFGFGR